MGPAIASISDKPTHGVDWRNGKSQASPVLSVFAVESVGTLWQRAAPVLSSLL